MSKYVVEWDETLEITHFTVRQFPYWEVLVGKSIDEI